MIGSAKKFQCVALNSVDRTPIFALQHDRLSDRHLFESNDYT